MKKVILYTNETCPYCKQIKETFKDEKIKFKEKDVRKNEKDWLETVSLTGMPTLPTILYDEEYLVPGRDFQNPQQIVNVLKNFKSSNFTDARKTLERIKTLNFHINTAFGRLDKTLKEIETKINKNEHKSTD